MSPLAVGPTQPPIPRIPRVFSVADHSCPPNVEVKNAWSYNSISLYAFTAWIGKTLS